MIVLVCGGRTYSDRERLFFVLDQLRKKHSLTKIVHGGAKGADALAGEWAADRGVPAIAHRADWRRHGRGAGPIRNAKMLREEKPGMVVAFPGGRGTRDMIERAEKAGVLVVQPEVEGVL